MKSMLFVATLLIASSSFATSTCIISWVSGPNNGAGDDLGRILVSCETGSSTSKILKAAEVDPTYTEIATQLTQLQQNGYKIISQSEKNYTLVK